MTVALVTTYNEADTIGPLVSGLLEHVDAVLVMDDLQSRDGTDRIAAAFGATVGYELGFATCLEAGFRRLVGEQVVVLDAGGSHDPADIAELMEQDADVVVGSRFLPGSEYLKGGPWWRPYASLAYSKACSLRAGYRISDWTSGFRLYSPDAVTIVGRGGTRARRHAWQVEVLAACLSEGLSVDEAPITYAPGRTSFGPEAALEALQVLGRVRC